MLAGDDGKTVPSALAVAALSGQLLKLYRAGGDENFTLIDAAQRIFWPRSAKKTVNIVIYEANTDGVRPAFFTESAAGTSVRICEWCAYTLATRKSAKIRKALNLAGAEQSTVKI